MALAQSPDVVDDRCGMAGRSRGVARLGTGQVEPDQAAQAYLKPIAGDAAAVQRAILLYRVTCVAQPNPADTSAGRIQFGSSSTPL